MHIFSRIRAKWFTYVPLFLVITLVSAFPTFGQEGAQTNVQDSTAESTQTTTSQPITTTEQMRNTDQYLFGSTVNVETPVDGDLSVFASSINIDQEVQGDIMATANSITLNAPVFDDVRIAASNIIINEGIGSDALLFAQDVVIADNAPIGQNLTVTANSVDIQSTIGQDLQAQANKLSINSSVQGDAQLSFVDIQIGENTRFLGDLEYSAPEQIPDLEVLVEGEVMYTAYQGTQDRSFMSTTGNKGATTVSSIVVLALIRAFLLPGYFRRSGSVLHHRPLVSLGRGVATYAVLPLIAILLIALGVTASLGGFVLTLRGFTLLWTPVVVVFVAASMLEYYVGDKLARSHRILMRVGAIVVLSFLIPLLPWQVTILLGVFAVGVVAQNDVHLMALGIFSLPKESLAEQEKKLESTKQ